MQNESLREIRLKISAGTASAEELQLWEAWISQAYIHEQQFVCEEEIEQRLRIDLAKPGWESFLEQQRHNLVSDEETGMTQPNNSDALSKESLSRRPASILIRRSIAAIIIGVVLSTAAYLLLNKQSNGDQQLAAVDYETIHSHSRETMTYTLPDGTKVWLNTNTTLRYPKEFGNNSRRVELNGEAWFDVAKDAQQAFIVLTDSSETRVLGTQFNIDAYKGSGILKITLLQGAILVGKRSEKIATKLEPGQQSIFSNGSFSVVEMDRPEEVTAWKRDSFAFDQTPLKEIMHKLAQYYGFKVKIDKEIENDKYTMGSTERTVPVIKILRGLERTKGFRIYPEKKSITPGETIMIRKNE